MERSSFMGKLSELLTFNVKHILDEVPPELILHKIFQPYSWLIRLFGILPLRARAGRFTCGLFTFPTLYTFCCFAIFVFDSCCFVPMYMYLVRVKGSQGQEDVTQVAHVLFISCQYLGAAVSYPLIPYTTPKLVNCFAEIQEVIVQISRLSSNREFVFSYVAARWKMRFWVLSSLSFTLFCVYSFGDGVEIYLGAETGWKYWIYYSGFCIFPFMISFHILHSMIFTTMALTLKSCYSGLTKHMESHRRKEVPRGYELYVKINEIVVSLGEIYGIYVVFEIIIMMTCITASIFFFISQLNDDEAKGLYVYAFVILPYVVWFHWICSTGEGLRAQGLKCLKAAKRSAIRDMDDNMEWVILEDPCHLSASNYFSINKRLFTTVIGTITTYLLVMLQFKVGYNSEVNYPGTSIICNKTYSIP